MPKRKDNDGEDGAPVRAKQQREVKRRVKLRKGQIARATQQLTNAAESSNPAKRKAKAEKKATAEKKAKAEAKRKAKEARSKLYKQMADEQAALHPDMDDSSGPLPLLEAQPSRRSGKRKTKTEARALKGKEKKISRKAAKNALAASAPAKASGSDSDDESFVSAEASRPQQPGSSSSATALKAASQPSPSFTNAHPLPLLVLLDLNGVLVHRAYSGAAFSVRPGTLRLLATLQGRVEIGFCSSMRYDNAKRAIQAIRSAAAAANDDAVKAVLLRATSGRLVFAGDDYHFRNDVGLPILPLRVPSLEPWRMLRNLSLIWRSNYARGHTAESTILCDDTVGKCPLTPENVVLVASWDGSGSAPINGAAAAEGWREPAAEVQGPDAVLAALATHLLDAAAAHLAAGSSADVRAWMRGTPFAAPPEQGGGRNGAASDAGLE